jgi:hypothetical protein
MVKLLPQFSTLHHVDELETYQVGYPRRPIFFLWKERYGIGKARNFFHLVDPLRHAAEEAILSTAPEKK